MNIVYYLFESKKAILEMSKIAKGTIGFNMLHLNVSAIGLSAFDYEESDSREILDKQPVCLQYALMCIDDIERTIKFNGLSDISYIVSSALHSLAHLNYISDRFSAIGLEFDNSAFCGNFYKSTNCLTKFIFELCNIDENDEGIITLVDTVTIDNWIEISSRILDSK